jgi:hypothetical protein
LQENEAVEMAGMRIRELSGWSAPIEMPFQASEVAGSEVERDHWTW